MKWKPIKRVQGRRHMPIQWHTEPMIRIRRAVEKSGCRATLNQSALQALGNPNTIRFYQDGKGFMVEPCRTDSPNAYVLQQPKNCRGAFVTPYQVIKQIVVKPGYTVLFPFRCNNRQGVISANGKVLIRPDEPPRSWGNRKGTQCVEPALKMD